MSSSERRLFSVAELDNYNLKHFNFSATENLMCVRCVAVVDHLFHS